MCADKPHLAQLLPYVHGCPPSSAFCERALQARGAATGGVIRARKTDSGLQRSRRARLPGDDGGPVRVHPLAQLLEHHIKLGRRAGRPQLRRALPALMQASSALQGSVGCTPIPSVVSAANTLHARQRPCCRPTTAPDLHKRCVCARTPPNTRSAQCLHGMMQACSSLDGHDDVADLCCACHQVAGDGQRGVPLPWRALQRRPTGRWHPVRRRSRRSQRGAASGPARGRWRVSRGWHAKPTPAPSAKPSMYGACACPVQHL